MGVWASFPLTGVGVCAEVSGCLPLPSPEGKSRSDDCPPLLRFEDCPPLLSTQGVIP